MVPGLFERCRSEAPAEWPEPDWTWESRSCLEEARPVIEFVATAMAREGYPDLDVFEMRLALEEALDNAIRHGNRGDPSKLVRVRWDVDPDRALVEVRGQGPGFDPDSADLTGLARWHRCLSWVRHNDPGNSITLCKYRSDL